MHTVTAPAFPDKLTDKQAFAMRRMFKIDHDCGWGQEVHYEREWDITSDAFGIVQKGKPFSWQYDKTHDLGGIRTVRSLVRLGLLSETHEVLRCFGEDWFSARNPGKRFKATDARAERWSFKLTEAGRAWCAANNDGTWLW